MENRNDSQHYRLLYIFCFAIIALCLLLTIGMFCNMQLWMYEFVFNIIIAPLILTLVYLMHITRRKKWLDLKGIIIVLSAPVIVPISGLLFSFLGQFLVNDPILYKAYYYGLSIYLYFLYIVVLSIVIEFALLLIISVIALLVYVKRKKDINTKV